LNLTRLAQNIEDLFFQETDPDKKRLMSQVSRVAACCQSFDRGLIKHLLAQLELQPIVDSKDCYDWLKSQHFFEEGQDRLDDVAQDVFRKLLWQEEREVFSRVHSLLADYFRTKSDRYASPESSYVDKYENDDWLKARSTYLYHRLFADRVNTAELVGHLLESRYFRENRLLQLPLQEIISEADLESHPFLSDQGRKFLIKIKPAIAKPWEVLEESPIDYDFNELTWNLSKAETDEAVKVCLDTPAQTSKLAEFMRLYCKSKRCPASSRIDFLMRAQQQVAQFTIESESGDFICDLLWDKVANTLFEIEAYEEAIAAYDRAIEIKPDKHEALGARGIALRQSGKVEEAIASYDRALEINRNDPDTWDNRGYALFFAGRYPEAMLSYDQALIINPQHANALYNKSCALALSGEIDLAITALQTSISIEPENRELAKTDPDFDVIRSDERFQQLIAEPTIQV
jgi:tetratricopeptide (TPR) repeat protein